MQERYLEYVLPREATEGDPAPLQVLRLTIGEMSTPQHARWLRLQRETRQWAIDVLGISQDDTELDDLPADIADRHELGYRRAAMLGALKRVEIGILPAPPPGDGAGKSVNEGDQEPRDWQEAELPKAWAGIDGFIDNVPWKVFEMWLTLAVACNEGAFFPASNGGGEKKRMAGQVSVRL